MDVQAYLDEIAGPGNWDPKAVTEGLTDVDQITTDYGFACYLMTGDALLILEFYIKPELRQTKLGTQLISTLNKLAQLAGKRVLIALHNTQHKNPQPVKTGLKNLGFVEGPAFNSFMTFVRGV